MGMVPVFSLYLAMQSAFNVTLKSANLGLEAGLAALLCKIYCYEIQ
jgi:hypothetical protein